MLCRVKLKDLEAYVSFLPVFGGGTYTDKPNNDLIVYAAFFAIFLGLWLGLSLGLGLGDRG